MATTKSAAWYDKQHAVVTYFLHEASKAAADPASGSFGSDALTTAMRVMEIMDVSETEWDRIVGSVLSQPKVAAFYYRSLLSSIVQHVSNDMAERIRQHFVVHGWLGALVNLLRIRHFRLPNPEEVLGIAEFHYKERTSSSDSTWQELSRFATGDDANLIETWRKEVEIANWDDIPF
ncbi:MAG: hypothetical protein PHV99_02840 [Candidatus Pacebacteria bacterium]|nr:hypothetical protein [Candidatus Paceibacterota bacterium]